MQRKQVRLVQAILLILIVATAAYQWWIKPGRQADICAFDQRDKVQSLRYVEHAQCRMACRDIDRDLVEEVYLEGALNCAKSDPKGKRGGNPRFALEKEDGPRGRVRIIVEDDHGKHVIITVIRLDKEDHCECS